MSTNTLQENKMGVMSEGKLLLNMALPMIASMLVQALYNVVDSVFVSQISESAVTALSLAFPIQNMQIGFAVGIGVGVNSLLSKSLGEKNQEGANRAAGNGLILMLIITAVFMLFGFFGVRPYYEMQSDVRETVEGGIVYSQICCVFTVGVFLSILGERLLQSTGRTFYTMITQSTGAIINIILDPIFIFGLKMGVAGAAVATIIGQFCGCALAIYFNHKKNTDITLSLRGFRPNWRLIGEIYAIGVPSIIMVCIGSVMTFCMNKILIAYTAGKETAATVFGVYFKLNSFIFMPVFGLNNGVIPIVAYNYGARNKHRMLHAIKLSATFACGVMIIGMLIFLSVPGLLLSLFDASAQMLSIGEPALRIISTSFAFAGVCIALGSVFQALGRGTYSMIVSFVRQLVVLVPCAYLLARWGLSIGNNDLVWLSYPIAEVFSLAVTLILFTRLYRKVIAPMEDSGAAVHG